MRAGEASTGARAHIATIARKELRGIFGSAVALIFLATFLGVVMFTFFWVDTFFARGVADLRPMFDWLPLLLIFLVAALSMRLWSEERRSGTLEILLTLPVPHWQLVLGKFAAGMLLVALALALTFGLPLTVSAMGNLDWGPVVGGYLAALLLAAAYLAVGLCVSSTTDNQMVALILTTLVCGGLYLPGTSAVVDLVGLSSADFLRSVGTGSRFASIARGVLDLRDLAYYLTLTAVFLALNVVLLGARRWSAGPRTRPARIAAQTSVALVAANALILNLWLAPLARARVDLTSSGEYSLSSTTKQIVSGLDEPLLVRAYFSSKTHPKLAPLVPRILDSLDEYRVIGGGRIRVEVVDPTRDPELEKEAKDAYGIESIPLRFADRHQTGVVSAFFHILVQYGDQREVLSFDDLIEVVPVGDEVEVRLKNFEYDLTRTIKKLASGFQSVDAVFAALPGKAKLTFYVTPDKLPESWKDAPALLDKVAATFAKRSGDKFELVRIEPRSEAEMQAAFDQWGVRPFASLASGEVYYFHLLLQVGNRTVRVKPPEQASESALETAITEGLKRAAPGFTKVVAIWSPPAQPPTPAPEGMPAQPTPPPQSFRALDQALGGSYEVRMTTGAGGKVDDDVDVLILAGPAGLDAAAARAVDQFLMRGGAVVALAGRYRLDLGGGQLAVEKIDSGLEAMLASWGVTVEPKLVMDSANDSFPIPVQRDLGGGVVVRDVQELPYPYFVKVTGSGLADDNVITAGVPGATLHWVSPVRVEEPTSAPTTTAAGSATTSGAKPKTSERKVEVLLSSSGEAWLSDSTAVQPDFDRHRATGGFAAPPTEQKRAAQPLAIAITGGFASWAAQTQKGLITHSPPDARLVVIGSSAFVSDDVLQLAQQLGSLAGQNNLQLVQNAVDWAVSDTELLAIRARSSAVRALTVPEDAHTRWELFNYGLALAGLGAVIGLAWLRRRSLRAMDLSSEVIR